MRQFLFACLILALISGAFYSFDSGVSSRVVSPHPGLPIASFGEIFRHF